MTRTVFITAPTLAPAGLEMLEHAGARILWLRKPHDPEAVEEIMAAEPIDAVISRTVRLSARAIDACPSLKVISKHGVGVSNIDVLAATRRGIPVYVTAGANAIAVAELTIGLMIGAARRIAFMDREAHAGRWSRLQDGVELHGRTAGVVGFGQIGQRVAAICLALGMRVVVHDPVVRSRIESGLSVEIAGSLDALLNVADVLTLHVPLTPATRHMIGARELALMPSGAIVVNTARGGVVDERALVAALESGRLHGAGLDTLEVEPLPSASPMLGMRHALITPHVGGSTVEALANMASGTVRNVLGWLNGAPPDPKTCVNPEVLCRLAEEANHVGNDSRK